LFYKRFFGTALYLLKNNGFLVPKVIYLFLYYIIEIEKKKAPYNNISESVGHKCTSHWGQL